MKYHFKVHRSKTDNGWLWAYCYELPDYAGTQGATIQHLLAMIKDWLECVLERELNAEDEIIIDENICECPEDFEEHFKETERDRYKYARK